MFKKKNEMSLKIKINKVYIDKSSLFDLIPSQTAREQRIQCSIKCSLGDKSFSCIPDVTTNDSSIGYNENTANDLNETEPLFTSSSLLEIDLNDQLLDKRDKLEIECYSLIKNKSV
jgi:hypothetical protein